MHTCHPQALLAASGQQLSKMNLQQLANVMGALPPLRAAPDQHWVDAACR
jgi:hypothetical protein